MVVVTRRTGQVGPAVLQEFHSAALLLSKAADAGKRLKGSEFGAAPITRCQMFIWFSLVMAAAIPNGSIT